jgi:uncharacterized protein with PIN domain
MGFMTGAILSATATVLIWTRMENKRISAAVEKLRKDLNAEITRITNDSEREMLKLIGKYERGDDF